MKKFYKLGGHHNFTLAFFSFISFFFSLSSFAQPANDIFTNATTSNSGTVCINTAGTLQSATVSAPAVATTCGIAGADVWYLFVAQSTNPTITFTGTGTSLTGVNGAAGRIQLFSGSYGALTSLGCSLAVGGVATLTVPGLTPGTTYYIRVYSNTVAPAGATWGFNICITDPLNDLCSAAILLTPGSACTPITGTLTGTTYTAMTGVPGCGAGGARNDVWYKFVAQSTNPVISTPTALAGQQLTLFTGDCTGFTASACGTTSISATGLTIGTTYYIRVYTNPNVAGNFTICITDAGRLIGAGNSYVNVTKKSVGGIVQNGDTLEIRSSYYWNNSYDASGNLTLVRFYDSVPVKTVMLTPLVPAGDTLLRVITNEGNTVTTNKFTYANADDAGAYNLAPGAGLYQIRINIGAAAAPWVAGATPPTAALAGQLTNTAGGGTINPATTLPIANGGTLTTASYFVKVTGIAGDTIFLATPKLAYRKASAPGADTIVLGTPYKIIISPNSGGLCPNTTGLNIASEFSGTFGSGATKERPTTLAVPIPAYNWRSVVTPSLVIGDGYYSLVNNTSQTGSTNSLAWLKTSAVSCNGAPVGFECAHRMFTGFWDIIGDHTGTNNSAGNPPPAPGTTGGYMLVVNADFTMSEAFKQTLTGLCPSTYYEYSAWVRNICRNCGIDINGSSTYKPGVLPNLTFSVNGIDYYSSGSVDTVGWMRKGFIFKTDTAQTTATIAIRNNAPGGGGNDWVMDDVGVSTCFPNMKYSPSMNPNVCRMNPLTIDDTVRSVFNNYVYYKWQRSTDGGTTWIDVTGPLGPSVPVFNGTTYQYITSYTIPPANTDTSDNGDLYRVTVATTLANLSSASCITTDGTSNITLSVTNCGTPLKTDLLSFNGKLVADKGNLTWTTSKEDEPITFTIERSNDGNYFSPIGSVNSHNNYTSAVNSYSFIDPLPVTGKVYYRLAIKDLSGGQKYSRIIKLSLQNGENFSLTNVINPFNYAIEFDITSSNDTKVDVELIDLLGKVVRKNSYEIHTGINALSLPNTQTLPYGTYIFRVKNNEVLINRKVLKRF
jgi:hypothetical protein